jgi:DNA replication and repair protein RecF
VRFVGGTKTFVVNGKQFSRLPAKLKKPVVLFEPNDLMLIYGSPKRRRDAIDRLIEQIEPSHGVNLRKFERVLKQRNNLLKSGAARDDLFIWDLQFADLAEKVITSRNQYVKEIDQQLAIEYQKIAGADDQVQIKYHPPENTKQQILCKLESDHAKNLPFTSVGPHKHDIILKIRGHQAKTAASRGENRTIIFALLQSMISKLQGIYGDVTILLDDIDSELDQERDDRLHKILNYQQVIITTIGKNRSSGAHKIQL